MKRSLRWIALIMCILIALSVVGCKKTTNSDREEQRPTAESQQMATADATAEPTADPEVVAEAAHQAFLELDREMFIWYVTQDITYLDQYVSNPSDYGIDESTVPVTMGEFSEAENTQWCTDCADYLSRLTAIDRTVLNAENQFAYDVMEQYLRYELMFKDTFYFYEPFAQYVGFQSNLPLTFGLYEFRDVQDVENYLTLMADVPRYMQQLIDFEAERAERGLFMTETALDSVLNDCQSIIDAKETCYLYDTFVEELDTLEGLTEEQRADYIARSNDLVLNSFVASYELLYQAMDALRSKCRVSEGMAMLGNEAKEYYAASIKQESSSVLEPAEAADLLVKYAWSCYNKFLDLYRADPTLMDRSDSGDPITFGTIDEDVAYLKQLMADYMPELPEVNVEYKDIPKELQDSFSPAAYLVPSVDGWKNNTVLINPSSGSDLTTLAHEAYPGHLFQFVYQRASDNESLFQRLVSPIGYEEGWTTNVELSISKRADVFDANYCLFEHYWSFFNYLLFAASSIYVNYMYYTESDLAEFLNNWNFGSYASMIYQESVDNPTYYFCYALGYCLEQEVYDKTYQQYAFTDKEFYTAYLDLGAGYYNLIEPAMLSWAESK